MRTQDVTFAAFCNRETYSRHMRIGATICDRRAISINMPITRLDTATTPNVPVLKISIHPGDAALTPSYILIDLAEQFTAGRSDNLV